MANTAPIYVKNITAAGTTWTNSDAANTKKDITPNIGAAGARVHTISVTSTDTVSRDFLLYLSSGGVDYLVGAISATALAGTTSGNNAVSVSAQAVLLPWLGSDGSILVPPLWKIRAENATQVTSAKTVTFMMTCGDY